ncbi:P-loop containing nucleoside triphosphate hydrolase protein [Metschnikowia bicuspidata]|uniref:P-loop containing nucleoside triphosphate hydrolase protein n=1 Tax=Metschnikowia bicuspidata TaxID=27322 RepID=A0A4P9Z7Q6_9ASCO|nr:P-loop containing nucleoside triphosphate hydrolase protein [Metschnikowia bicuspidata]
MWLPFFTSLNKKFQLINTHLTFFSSFSRGTIPTLELLQKLDNNISCLDLQMIKQLFPPGDVTFGYFDESQILLQHAEKVLYSGEKGYKQNQPKTIEDAYKQVAEQRDGLEKERQLLVFEFCDVRTNAITAIVKGKRYNPLKKMKTLTSPVSEFFLASKSMDMGKLSQSQLQAIIMSRNERFCGFIQDHLDHFTESEIKEGKAFKNLVEQCAPNLPKPWRYQDPVVSMQTEGDNISHAELEKPTADEMLCSLRSKPLFKNQIRFLATWSEKRAARYECIGSELIHGALSEALWEYKQIALDDEGLYSHQVQALSSIILQEKHVIVSTSTSSGKSLIYQIPILNEILRNCNANPNRRVSTALLIFPTKALAQDQLRHFQELISCIPGLKRKIVVGTYDGDTSFKDKSYVRNYADIIFTNPDAIHAAILPLLSEESIGSTNRCWNEFFSCLRYVIVDELHVYKGNFGVHFSYVMARLNRMHSKISQKNSVPIYISCSATIQDPACHLRTICAIPASEHIEHISMDGSPGTEKKIVVWEPPVLMNKNGQIEMPQTKFGQSTFSIESLIQSAYLPRESIITELAKILVHLLCSWPTIKGIVFCPIRVTCELLTKEVKSLIANPDFPEWGSLHEHDVMAYRGGYSKSDRRAIEQKMFKGHLRAIVATNALELGIDLSDLDVVISCGFPHLKANLHQQFGRAGRGKSSRGSLAILVCGSNPVDRYYLKNCEELCDKSAYEDLCVDGLLDGNFNQLVMSMHLQCAAFEWPLDLVNDIKWFSPRDNPRVNENFYGVCIEKLIQDKKGTFGTDPRYLPWPPEKVSLRAIELNMFAVVDVTANRNKVIEEVEELRTSFTLYEGGIFLHQGLPYLVKEFNSEKRYAKVERVKVSWVTQQRDFTDIDPMEIELVKQLRTSPESCRADLPVFYGKIQITTIVFGFFKVSRTMEILEALEVTNPPFVFKSKGFWLDIPSRAIEAIKQKLLNPAGAIHAAQHAIMNILPIYISNGATTRPNVRWSPGVADAEISTECKAPEKEFAKRQSSRKRPPRLIFHDSKGGEQGTGVCAKTFEYIDQILIQTYEAVLQCECEWGCPQCVAGYFCKEMMLVMSKPGAIILLGTMIGKDIQELKDLVKDGPEPNMPKISTETISDKSEKVKMSPKIEIVPEKKNLASS